jgi:hypothetical protein
MRFARGTRTGSPAAVWPPRTGSATIWAACMPSAHSPAAARQPPAACAAAPGDSPLPDAELPGTELAGAELPGAEERGQWNQSDTSESAACAGSCAAAAAVGITGIAAAVGITGIGATGTDVMVVARPGVGAAAAQPFPGSPLAGWLLAGWLLAGWLLARCSGASRLTRPPDQGDGPVPCSVTLSGNHTRTISPRGDLARSRTRTPCRSASRLLELLHAARALNPSTVTVATANTFPANQG